VVTQLLPDSTQVNALWPTSARVQSTTAHARTSSVRYKDLSPSVDSDQALYFLDALHRDSRGHVELTVISRGPRKATFTGVDTWEDARQAVLGDPRFWTWCESTELRWDVYTAVASFRKPSVRGHRGLARDACEIPGVYADLDVKPDQEGAFKTRAELEAFLAKLPPATMRVATGSGGEHVYWLSTERTRERPDIERLLDGWYDYLTVVAGETGHIIDHVQEGARILRVAGTIRWPKVRPGDPGRPMPVRLAVADGPRYALSDILNITEPHRTTATQRHRETCDAWQKLRDGHIKLLESWNLNPNHRALLEEKFNRTEDWERLLLPLGWQLDADRRDGSGWSSDCRFWVRPGKKPGEGGSASTDSPRGHPGTMFIYTTDPLLDPCVIPLGERFKRVTTKYHFALHFHFHGDESALLQSIIRGGGRLS